MSEPGAAPAVAETHISLVFFTADRAFKLLKPVRTSFLDHTDPADRMRAIDRERRLNARLAPDVYLGTADIVENHDVVDRMLVMRRMPADRRLSTLLRDGVPRNGRATNGDLEPLRAVARAVASFHARVGPHPDVTLMASADGLGSLWESSFADLEQDIGEVISVADFERARSLVRTWLAHHAELFDRRRADGWVRDGHGDLTAEDIFVLEDGPRILDCLAFDDEMRICDVLGDIGFLVMDVHRLAGPGAARRLMDWYTEFTGEHHPSSLAHHWVAYRAHVRAKIEMIRHRQGVADAGAAAREYHDLALHHLERARLRVVVVGGGPGSGKSTLAHAVAARTGWFVLGSDELRKDLAGIDHRHRTGDAPGEGLYSDETKAATYAELVRRAGRLLAAGESVILDASFTDRAHRRAAADVAERHGASFIEIECHVDADVVRHRIVERQRLDTDASDADTEIIEHLAIRHDPWPTATAVDTSGSVDDAVARVLGVALPVPAS